MCLLLCCTSSAGISQTNYNHIFLNIKIYPISVFQKKQGVEETVVEGKQSTETQLVGVVSDYSNTQLISYLLFHPLHLIYYYQKYKPWVKHIIKRKDHFKSKSSPRVGQDHRNHFLWTLFLMRSTPLSNWDQDCPPCQCLY